MAVSGRWQYFPLSHALGILIAIVLMLTVLLWPSRDSESEHETRFVIEMTDIPSTTEPHVPINWEQAEVRSGDNLSLLLSRHNLNSSNVVEIVAAAPKEALRLRPGQKLRWVRSQDNNIQSFQIELSPLIQHAFERDEAGVLRYQLIERDADHRPRHASVVIENSLFVDGARAGISEAVLIELANIFGWDIDFALDIRQGDSFSLIYDEVYLDGERIGTGSIQAARFINQGRTLTAIRYTDSKGISNYYTPQGQSMRKEFLRNPIDFARISSRFNLNRKHPVLMNTIRAHKGTDYAAPTGTPIKAAGDGKVTFAGRKGGYGNVVIIQHGSRYETLYAHLSKFNQNARVGRYVKQGQVIGYVGSTGLATGPHLHYEFRMDGVHRDSLRMQLPKANAVPADQREKFEQRSASMLSWLDSFEENRNTALMGASE